MEPMTAPSNWFERYTTPAMLTQEVTILLACLIALFAAHFIRLAYLKRPRPAVADWTDLVLEGGALINPPLVIIVLLLIARGVLVAVGMPTAMLDITLQFAASFAVVRLATFGLRLMMGPRSWFVRWERRITWVAWAGLSTQILGWFEPVRAFLDRLDLAPGEATKFSLWMLIESIVVVTVFVVVASLIAGDGIDLKPSGIIGSIVGAVIVHMSAIIELARLDASTR